MKKLELNLDELRVETFEVDGKAAERGTVMGQEDSSAKGFGCVGQCFSANHDTNDVDACGATMVYSCNCNSGDWECAASDMETCVTCDPECM